MMNGLLIANKDEAAREEMAALFQGTDYNVVATDSVANSLEGILDKSIQVVLLSGSFDEQYVAKFVPLLKKCNRNLSIILVSDEMPLDLVRRIRKEGIFYHALEPVENESWDEILQVVSCAFENYHAQQNIGRKALGREFAMRGTKSVLTSLALILMLVPQVKAADTSLTYNSGILVLLFVGFCALLIVAQLVPAILALFGMTKEAAQNSAAKKRVVVSRKH
jgi:DNA-binding NtrC family response regulator